jgi:hypothetical protein
MTSITPLPNDPREQFAHLTTQRVLAYDRLWQALETGINVRSAMEYYEQCKEACRSASDELIEQSFAKESEQ